MRATAGLLDEEPGYVEMREQILSDPAAAYWIKRAIRELGKRDPVDAVRDAEQLANLMRKRMEEMTVVMTGHVEGCSMGRSAGCRNDGTGCP